MAVMASKLCQKKLTLIKKEMMHHSTDNDVALEKHEIALFFELVSRKSSWHGLSMTISSLKVSD